MWTHNCWIQFSHKAAFTSSNKCHNIFRAKLEFCFRVTSGLHSPLFGRLNSRVGMIYGKTWIWNEWPAMYCVQCVVWDVKLYSLTDFCDKQIFSVYHSKTTILVQQTKTASHLPWYEDVGTHFNKRKQCKNNPIHHPFHLHTSPSINH